jgi:hypothetical protein
VRYEPVLPHARFWPAIPVRTEQEQDEADYWAERFHDDEPGTSN